MTDISDMLVETAGHVLADLSDDHAGEAHAISALAEAGLTQPFSGGGGDVTWADICPMIRAIGGLAPFSTLADLIAADFLANRYGLAVSGPALVADGSVMLSESGTVSGHFVASAAPSQQGPIIVDALSTSGARTIVALAPEQAIATPLHSVTGEARIAYDVRDQRPLGIAEQQSDASAGACLRAGALVRSALISGAVEKAASLTRQHCATRKQFGRPLCAFQAIQQQIAVLACESHAAEAIVSLAARRFDTASGELCVGAAKLRTAKAARLAVDLSHQCHGAIGFTEEYPLQRYTRRLLAWRGEFGAQRTWSQRIGAQIAASDQRFWELAVGAAGERDAA